MKNNKKSKDKKPYKKPALHSEKIMGFGAKCNGTTVANRKTIAGAPDFCDASRLLS